MNKIRKYYTMADHENGLCDINGNPYPEGKVNDSPKETESPEQEKTPKGKKKDKVSKKDNDA